MQDFPIGRLTFTFPNEWQVSRYDEWTFFKRFQSILGGGVKGVDLLAIDTKKTAWLIEVKDYRSHPREKAISLPKEIAQKAFDTLAGLLPAKVGSDEGREQTFAKAMHGCVKLRIVLHLEQPTQHSKLRPRAIAPLDVQQKLRCLVKAVDAHPVVCESSDLSKVGWQVVSS